MSSKPAHSVGVEAMAERHLENNLKAIGESHAVRIFLSGYGKVRTRAVYLECLKLYLKWLGEHKGVGLTCDELIRDNLEKMFDAKPVDVATKRTHTDWLNEYVNEYLVKLGRGESRRMVAAAAITQFYKRNDSALFGFFKLASGPIQARDRPLDAADIRIVLKAMPLNLRAPLLAEWQSGIEINRLLSLKWTDLGDLNSSSLKLDFIGRKHHRQPYFTFFGRDTLTCLRSLERKNEYVFAGKTGVVQNVGWIGSQLKKAARRLKLQGLIQNGDPGSWHSHAFRASFKTEAEHAKIPSGFIEFFMGHDQGVAWHYDRRNELHEDDFIEAYRKLEPFVSLEPTRVAIEEEYQKKDDIMLREFAELKRAYFELREAIQRKQT